MCAQITAAYCFDHLNDGACAFFIPTFETTVDEPKTLAVHTTAASSNTKVYFGDCCGAGCDLPTTQVSVDIAAGFDRRMVRVPPSRTRMNNNEY